MLLLVYNFSKFWLALKWYTHILWLKLNGPFTCLMQCWFALNVFSHIRDDVSSKQEDRFHG